VSSVRGLARRELKRGLRHLVAAAGAIERRAVAAGPRVLCYHGVCEDPPDEWSVTPEQLRRHLDLVTARYVPTALGDIVDWLEGGRELPDNAVAFTFDDGFVDVLETVAPLFAAAGVPGAVFVVSGLTSGTSSPDPSYRPSRPVMSWRDVEEIAALGWTVGSHSVTHPQLSSLPPARARDELQRSRDELEQRLQRRVDLLAYPYGTTHTVSPRDHLLAAEAGYRAAFLDMTGRLSRECDVMALPRSKVLGIDSSFVARASVAGRLDRWRLIEARG
jgi:peptidoglycan/xylan/chitin deacetylase (PgdA/CDA1 family)